MTTLCVIILLSSWLLLATLFLGGVLASVSKPCPRCGNKGEENCECNQTEKGTK